MPSCRPFLSVCLFAAFAIAVAKADTFNAMYVFGDSLSDVGNAYIGSGGTTPASPPYSNGRFSNGNIWVQDLATSYNLPAIQPSLAGGNDYAVGGATTSSTGVGNLGWQLSQFAAANPTANPNGLYMIWIGTNDVDGIVASHSATPQAAAQAVVGNIDSAIQTLVGEGARNFLVVGVPDLGDVPGAIENGPATVAATSALSQYFNSSLEASLSSFTGGPNITFMDTYSLMDNVVNDPSAYGLTNVDTPCLTVDAQNQPVICSNPNQYLFWDVIHPTAAGQQLVANLALQTITEQAVPEPATRTMFLSGTGILVLVLGLRRWYLRPNGKVDALAYLHTL